MRNPSTRLGGILAAALCAAALGQASAAHAAASVWVGDARAQARLVTAVDAVAGTSLQAGIEFHFPRGWHGYWRTPGDAGVAPHPDWSHAPDVASATMQWPAPTRLVIDGLQNAVYREDVVLPTTIRLRQAGAPAHLNLTLDYAACSNVCVPEHAALTLALPAATDPPPASAEAAELDAARRAVPVPAAQAGISVISSDISMHAGVRSLDIHLRSSTLPFTAPDLFVEGAGSGLPAAPVVRLSNDRRDAELDVALPGSTGNAQSMTLTLVDGARAVEIGPASANGRASILPLLSILLTAFAGGLILNLMPCVLPVLSLKAFALLKTAGASRRSTSRLAGASVLGTLAAFALLALALSALKLGGVAIGWGIQFQQPWFLASMAVATALFAASLFDWLAIGLPRTLADLAGTATTRGPLAEAFVSGAFSTLLATPCSAPLVGTAIGFALGRGPVEIVAVLLAMGLGMSSPFLAIAIAPSLVAWLPRPGPWMNRVRTLLGLLLLATTGWLLVLLASATGVRIALAVALVIAALLGMRALLSGAGKAPASRWTTPLLAGLAIGAIVVAALPKEHDSAPAAAAASRTAAPPAGDGWQAFDPARIPTLVAKGKTVFVDVDATWCLTCKVNALTVLRRPEIQRALAAPNLVRMRADWSHADPGIARYVDGFGRAGIPLDVVYGPGAPNGRALPELLNTSAILDALDRARM
ncbi:protein-disulfide reductase DsbD family protein [Burkholderia sp. Ac-20379]|uniref:protein-disulfide reductase DsbD family protein n=1 Tax=Burkholderia sp. Ac-20379 TaxID=2703900 RepID=UPI00197EF5E8|nr:protein-disulfide reductase DsbD domain-containing protein [Burkholderia sp. Ac-20379]MBN3723248.1 protein-disulfide reductase [Burkholderia sp. Ac-20379]